MYTKDIIKCGVFDVMAYKTSVFIAYIFPFQIFQKTISSFTISHILLFCHS